MKGWQAALLLQAAPRVLCKMNPLSPTPSRELIRGYGHLDSAVHHRTYLTPPKRTDNISENGVVATSTSAGFEFRRRLETTILFLEISSYRCTILIAELAVHKYEVFKRCATGLRGRQADCKASLADLLHRQFVVVYNVLHPCTCLAYHIEPQTTMSSSRRGGVRNADRTTLVADHEWGGLNV